MLSRHKQSVRLEEKLQMQFTSFCNWVFHQFPVCIKTPSFMQNRMNEIHAAGGIPTRYSHFNKYASKECSAGFTRT